MKATREFNALLRDCNVQAAYEDVTGRRRRASVDALLSLLQSLGIEIDRPDQATGILRARQHERSLQGIEPVHVAWNGAPQPIAISLPAAFGGGQIDYRIECGSQIIERSIRFDSLPLSAENSSRSSDFVSRMLPLPGNLPWRYHRLRLTAEGRNFESLIISTPRKAFVRDDAQAAANKTHHSNGEARRGRSWGVFLPLYALRTRRDWGVGDFTDLGELMDWVGALGASDVGTLPLLATFLDEPYEISPYRPASRLFWNELYIDVESIPEMRGCTESRQLVSSDGFRRRIAAQRGSELVDYCEVMKLKREVLAPLAAKFFEERPQRFDELAKFILDNPALIDYARFRAVCERQRASWPSWPERLNSGDVTDRDYDKSILDYHVYVQWIAHEQLAALRRRGEAAGCNLYLDLPIGVDPRGYDVWRHREMFAPETSVGSPPDVVFPKGQDWGLPPMVPERLRAEGYVLFRRVMETSCKFAGRLRIDHVLGFHRLYCIPPGFEADQGAYVRYNADELYAVATLESHRNRCELVGENLGTVPISVDRQIARHGIAGMWVAPYELEPGRRAGLSPPPPQHVAMLNTHDMPPLAAWWKAADVADRIELGLVNGEAAARERDERLIAIGQLKDWLRSLDLPTMEDELQGDADVPVRPLLRGIAASEARLVLINLEDLWLETRPQNIPSVSDQRPNWRRKTRYRLDEIMRLPEVIEALRETNELRKAKEPTIWAP
ncbi:MAG TPA: 4-alpha-glucanotransferase [Lacipirellulaceae bacterium]|nr:4-alpha-glucanotransferase [Lacipirellulaceae bacterium]